MEIGDVFGNDNNHIHLFKKSPLSPRRQPQPPASPRQRPAPDTRQPLPEVIIADGPVPAADHFLPRVLAQQKLPPIRCGWWWTNTCSRNWRGRDVAGASPRPSEYLIHSPVGCVRFLTPAPLGGLSGA